MHTNSFTDRVIYRYCLAGVFDGLREQTLRQRFWLYLQKLGGPGDQLTIGDNRPLIVTRIVVKDNVPQMQHCDEDIDNSLDLI